MLLVSRLERSQDPAHHQVSRHGDEQATPSSSAQDMAHQARGRATPHALAVVLHVLSSANIIGLNAPVSPTLGLHAETSGRPRSWRVKGAQARSCSVSVLMEETGEQVASMHPALLLLANDRQPAGLIWRL